MNALISLIQVILFCTGGIVFFMNVEWSNSRPISEMTDFLNQKSSAVPSDAKYFSSNHGEAKYFSDSPRENPSRYWFYVIGMILSVGLNLLTILIFKDSFLRQLFDWGLKRPTR